MIFILRIDIVSILSSIEATALVLLRKIFYMVIVLRRRVIWWLGIGVRWIA